MKKTLLLATAIGLMLPASAYAEDIVLKFWDNQQTESGLSQYQQEAVTSFEAANPGIKVEVTTIPYPEYQQRLLTAVQGGNAPDVSTVDQIWVAAFAEAGAIDPLDDVAKAAGVTAETFFPGAWASANYDGKLWGIPFNVDVWQFSFYNADLLKAAGVDPASVATFEGLKAAGEKLTGNGKFGIGLFAHKGEDTVVVLDSFIFSNGGKVLNDDGSCGLTSDASVGALAYLASLAPYAPAGIANASSGDMRELFLNGSLAIEFWPALEQPTLQKSKINWDFVNGTAPEGKTADRHLWRLEPGDVQELAAQGSGLEVHPVPHPGGRQRQGRRPASRPTSRPPTPSSRRTARARTASWSSSTTPPRVRCRRATSRSPTSR